MRELSHYFTSFVAAKFNDSVPFSTVDEVGEKLDIGDTPLEISTEVMEDKESKEEDGSEVIKVYIFKAEADDDLG